MGVVNVTPDSFSDGGDYLNADAALTRALNLLADGADLIDLGAESTRPGALPVSADEEWARLKPVLQGLVAEGLGQRLSVDTQHGITALKAANEFGVGWVNNIRGLFDSEVLRALSRFRGLTYVAMHMHGTPATMQRTPLVGSKAVEAVSSAFTEYHETLLGHGFDAKSIVLDPGIGFGKDDSGNLKLIAEVSAWSTSYQILVGVSRKSFMGRLLEIPVAKDRDSASKMLEFALILQGAKVIRTHEVRALANICQVYFSESGSC